MTDRTYVFRLTGDFQQLDQAANRAGASVDGLAGRSDGLARNMAAAGAGGDRFAQRTLPSITAQGKLTAQQLTQVGYQLNDFAVQVASGGSPFLALVQQGSQLSGTFGGVGNAARALVSLITPARLAIGGLAGAFVAVAAAAVQGYQAQVQFEKSLALTGNRAGLTSQRFEELAAKIAGSTTATIGASKEALQAVVSTGRFGPDEIEAVTKAVLSYADKSGQAAADVAKDFAGMADSASRWAVERNKSLNFITAAQLRYIRQLEAEGKAGEAVREVSKLLYDQLGNKAPAQLGYLMTVLDKATKAASSFWNAILNVGKPANLEDQLKSAVDDLEFAQKRLSELQGIRGANKNQLEVQASLVAGAKARVEALEAQRREEERMARAKAANAKENADEIAKMDSAYIDAKAAKERAGFAQLQAQREVNRSAELQALERQYDTQQIFITQYVARRKAIEQQAINDKAAAIDQEIALENRRVAITDPEKFQQQARLSDLQARRTLLQKELLELEQQARSNFGKSPREVAESAQSAFRLAELGQTEDVLNSYRERRVAAVQAALELRQTNSQLSIDLIKNDRERGLALIAQEEEQLRKRLDLNALAGEERKRAEDEIANYVALRNQQLTEQLKPQWQRMLEAWRDTQQLMRDASDDFQTTFLQTSEDTWVEFIKTGEISFKRLGQVMLEALARYQFQSGLGQYAGQLGSTIAQFFFGSSGSGSAVGGSGTIGAGGSGGGSIYALTNGGGRAGGGPVGPGSFYKVVENGPELYDTAGGTYLLNPRQGMVRPLQAGAAGAGDGVPSVTVNVIGGQQPDKVETRQDPQTGGLTIDLLYGQIVRRLNQETAQGYGVAPGVQSRFGGSGSANLGR